DRRQPDVAPSLGGSFVCYVAKTGEAALAAGGRGLAWRWDLLVRPPAGHLDTGVVQPVGKLSTGWNGDPNEIGAVADEIADRRPGLADRRRRQRQADPRSRGVTEQVEQLVAGRAVRGNPLDRARRQAGRLGLGCSASAGVA